MTDTAAQKNSIITPSEAASMLSASVRDAAAKLPEAKRGVFYAAVAGWLSGGVYR